MHLIIIITNILYNIISSKEYPLILKMQGVFAVLHLYLPASQTAFPAAEAQVAEEEHHLEPNISQKIQLILSTLIYD